MTHAAAATRTPHTSRRRPSAPAAWERAGALCGVVGATALVIATFVLASAPSVDSTPAAVKAHLDTHYALTVAAAYTICVAALLLVPFLASLHTFTARRAAGGQWRWTVTLVAGAIGITMVSLEGALLATATQLAVRSSAEQAVFAVFVAAKLVSTLALLPVAGLVLANARTIATSQRRPERWLIRFDIEIAIFAVSASIATFVDKDWLAPGEPIAAVAWLLVAMWVVALAVTIARRDRANTYNSEDQP